MNGLLLAIEGIDGSGKGTQATMLRERLAADGLRVGTLSFPRYEQTTFGRMIAEYLNGKFGQLGSVGPHFAALLYAGDRFESLPLLRQLLSTNDVVICDRYVPSNLAHQGAKLPPLRLEQFVRWLEAIEYGVYALPRPDLVVLLDLPVDRALQLIAAKPARTYTEHAADLHESNREYLTRTAEIYRWLSKREPNWRAIHCCDRQMCLRSPEQIHEELLAAVLEVRAQFAASS